MVIKHHTLVSEIIVVTSINTKTIDKLSKNELKNLYVGKDRRIKITVLNSGETHKSFVVKFIKKTTTQFKRHWKKLLFTGKASLPYECKGEPQMVEYLFKNPESVGYINDKFFDSKRLKKITIH